MNKNNKFHLFLLFTLTILNTYGIPESVNQTNTKNQISGVNNTLPASSSLLPGNIEFPTQSGVPHSLLPSQHLNTAAPQNPTHLLIKPTISTRSLPVELQPTNPLGHTNTVGTVSELNTASQTKNQDEKIEFNFEDADLQTLVKHIETLFDITFISDDMMQPIPQGGHSLKGNKISFKTNKLLSKQEAWDLFVIFLRTAGFALIPEARPDLFRIKTIDAAKRSPLTTFIGIDPSLLPDNDEMIRYCYFIENSPLDTIKAILEKLRSTASDLIILTNHKAFILTDTGHNIKTLMQIVKELDKVSMPQSMSVLKLRRADAQEVKNLYDSLIGPSSNNSQQFFQARKQPTSLYFPENTTIIAEPRTNSLILLGTKESINTIETFIIKNIDIELDTPYSPLYVHQLKYADAITIADIMGNITKDFGQSNIAGQHGGVRGIDKFMRPITFIPEETTNRIIIKGHYDDYKASLKIIEKLDEAQPQVAIEVLILSVTLTNKKQLGAQIRSKDPGATGLLGNNVKFQTSGLYQTEPVQLHRDGPGVTRLLGNLINLATGAAAGNTIISLGSDAYGVWGIFQALQTAANAQIVSNPFLVATNKTKATISVGETRRVQTGVVFSGGSSGVGVGTPTFGDEPANLTVEVIPQINSDGMIVLQLTVDLTNFLNPEQPTSATKLTRVIKTSTIVANKEVLALGGLIRNNINNDARKTPVLGNIPVLGWLFKNQSKTEDKDNLLILISSRIIEPHLKKEVNRFNTERIDDYHGSLAKMHSKVDDRDPIHKLFFTPEKGSTEQIMDDFLIRRAHLGDKPEPKKIISQRKAKRLQKKNTKKNMTPTPETPATLMAQAPQVSYKDNLTAHTIPMPIMSNINTLVSQDINSLPTTTLAAINNKKRTNLALTDFFSDAGTRV